MKISIIVPNLPGEIYLPDCEASIAAQGFSSEQDVTVRYVTGSGFEIEAILKNDSSEAPRGVAAVRNLGIEAAKGDYILFLDSDDYLADRAVAALAEQAKAYPDDLIALTMRETWYKRDTELKAAQKPEKQIQTESAGSRRDGRGTFRDSVLGILIPAKYIKDDELLRFDESLDFYSDIPFMAVLLAKAGIRYCDALYYKRKRNDAIRYPSLSQIHSRYRYTEFDRACGDAAELLEQLKSGTASENSDTAEEFDRERISAVQSGLWRYICDFFLDKMLAGMHPEGLEWGNDQLTAAESSLLAVPAEFIKSEFKGTDRAVLSNLRCGKQRAAVRRAKLSVMKRKKKGLFGSALQWKWNIYKLFFRKLPVRKNLFLFESFSGRSYGDSCRAIYEYMVTHVDEWYNPEGEKGKIKFVWIIDNKDARIPGKHKEAKPESLRYFYYVARCGAWINNMRQPDWYEKRPGVIFLETWHGTPLKKLVFDMEDVHSASPEYKKIFYKQSRIWDWLISDNRFSTDVFESAFLYPREQIIETGYPRNDLLYGRDRDSRAALIREKLGIPKDKKVVLYAPTWRDDDYYESGRYRFELPLDLKIMKRLKDKYFFILRMHYFIADNMHLNDHEKSFVMDCSRYNDIGELYLISDVLITDYSSVFFDYANLRRPILFYVYDFEKYRDTLRGFYFDMETGCPGPLLKTGEEVADALLNIDVVEREYADKYREFTERFCSLDDGHAAERVVKAVFSEICGESDR